MRLLQSILLTGGAGFIGSSLARHLLRQEGFQRLVVLDTLAATGHPGHLADLEGDPRFALVEGDIRDQPLVAHLITSCGITGVMNLAAEHPADPPTATTPSDFAATNVAGTAGLLEVCRLTGTPLLQCSTAEVYGPVAPPERSTEADAFDPATPGAASKAGADLMCLAARRAHGQDIVITRATYTYGPRQPPSAFIPTVVRHAMNDEPVPLAGHGMQVRDWIHVDDHCRGIMAAFLRGTSGEVFNLGGACERTQLGVARNLLEVLGKPVSLLAEGPRGPGSGDRFAVDTTKALNYFSWRPEVSIREALADLARELASNLAAVRG